MLGVVGQQYCVVGRGLNVHRQVVKTDAKNARGWEGEKARLFFRDLLTTWDHCTGDVICCCMFAGLSFYLKISEHLLQRKISHRFVFKWHRFTIQNPRQLAHRFERRSQSGFRLFQKKKKLLTTPTNEYVSYLQLTNTVYANTNNMATMDTT